MAAMLDSSQGAVVLVTIDGVTTLLTGRAAGLARLAVRLADRLNRTPRWQLEVSAKDNRLWPRLTDLLDDIALTE